MPVISLQDTYEALRVFEILGIKKKPDVSKTTCQTVLENLGSSSPPKDLFYALKVNSLLKCRVNEEVFKVLYSQVFIMFCACHDPKPESVTDTVTTNSVIVSLT